LEAIETSIEKFASLGLSIKVTELDVKIVGTINQDAYINQARYYKQILDIFKKHKDVINTVVFWGVTDDTSWIEEDPLLFNDKFQAKPAFFAIADPSKVSVNRKATQAVAGTPVLGENADKLWSTVKYFKVDSFVKGFSGAKGTAQVMWDSNNLYLKLRVADATHGSKDSIELFIDKNNAKTDTYQSDDKHYIINRDNSLNSELSPIITEDAEGYTVQVAIPVEDINLELGKTIGFDLRINDDQNTGNVDSIVVLNDFGNRQDTNTAYFSDLKLEAASKILNVTKGTPIIDGVRDAIWSKATEISTNTWVTGTSGATAKARAMWDDKNLYVMAEVKDNLLNKESKNAHEQDSVEVFLDQNNEKTTSYQADDGQFRVNFNNDQSFGGSTDKTGFKSATKVDGTNYVVEMAIPLSKVKVENGAIAGFDLQVNNADATGKRVSVAMWCDPTGNSWASTLNYGNIMLVDDTTSQANVAAELVEKALAQKDFYNFNVAYGSIMSLNDEKIKAELLDQLSKIQDIVWKEDIKNAVAAVVNASNKLDSASLNKAEEIVAKVSNTYSKEYLLGEIAKLKVKIK
jgi:endo-1,4-beta-xylanase